MDTSIGSKIKALRLYNKISQKELCSGYMSRVILSRIENNKMLPSLSQIEYIANKLGKSIEYFLSTINYNDVIANHSFLQKSSILAEMFNNKMYYNLVKYQEDLPLLNTKEIIDYNEDYYWGMSYFYLDISFKAIKPLRRYVNKYLESSQDIQKCYVLNFLNALNTLFKIMIKNKNYPKCENYLLAAIKFIYTYNVDDAPISFIIHNNLACLYLKQHRYKDIITLLFDFIDKHKEILYVNIVVSMYLSLNIAYYNLGRYSKSIECIKKAINLYLYLDKKYDALESYFNYINALRYSFNFQEAINILEQCIQDCKDYSDLYDRFLVQKMILKFNTGHYDEVLAISKDMDVTGLPKSSKYNYYFMIGHIEYIRENYKRAYQYLTKPERYFKQQNYSDDLYILYDDLFNITNDIQYETNAQKYREVLSKRKNILV